MILEIKTRTEIKLDSLEDRDKLNLIKTVYSKSFKHNVTRKEVLDYILAIDAECTARVHEIKKAIKAQRSCRIREVYRYGYLRII